MTLAHRSVEKRLSVVQKMLPQSVALQGCYGGVVGACWSCYPDVSGLKLNPSKRKLDRKDVRLKGLKASQKSKPQLAEQN